MDMTTSGIRDLDVSRPNSARIYDYMIGGTHHYAIDRAHGQKSLEILPNAAWLCQENRKWLQRSVRYAAEHGIDQFLDLGSGMPSTGHVHEVVHAVNPDARVVYVDNEPVAVAHSEIMLDEVDNAAMVAEDLRDPAAVLDHPTTRDMLDLERPIMVVMAAVLHFVAPEDEPRGIIEGYTWDLAPGSLLAISHDSGDDQGENLREVVDLYKDTTNPVFLRSREEVRELLAGWELVEPGVVWTPQWRPDDPGAVPENPEQAVMYAAVGRKPAP
jgi:hypothetical protein